jgi:hypothetical protein
MTTTEIIDALNRCAAALDEVGESIPDVLIDARTEEGLPPYPQDELAAIEAECRANAVRSEELWDEIHALLDEYEAQTGRYPIQDSDDPLHYRAPHSWER